MLLNFQNFIFVLCVVSDVADVRVLVLVRHLLLVLLLYCAVHLFSVVCVVDEYGWINVANLFIAGISI